MDYAFAYPWARKELLRETSIFTTHLKIRDLREYECLSKMNEHLVKVVVYGESEPICCDESFDPKGPFCFFYTTIFTKIKLHLPLFVFEKELLTELNVALAQLHLNN